MAKRLGKSDQLSYQSSPQLKADLVAFTARLGLKRGFFDRKLSEGHVVNAITLWVTRLPPEQGEVIASHALDMLEEYVVDKPVRTPDISGLCPEPKPSGIRAATGATTIDLVSDLDGQDKVVAKRQRVPKRRS